MHPVRAANERGSWWSSNVDPEAQTFGNAYSVEHRYAGDIIEGIKATSFKLQAP